MLERKLRANLNCARIAHRADRSENRRSVTQASNRSEVGVVEDIEYLSTKLQFYSLLSSKIDVLEEGEVKSFRRWTIDYAATCISDHIRNACTGGGNRLEARRNEPLLKSVRCVGVRIAQHIRSISAANVRCVRFNLESKWQNARSISAAGIPLK